MFGTAVRRGAATMACACAAGMAPGAASAVDLGDRFELHGYGYQDYMQSSGNTYLGADRHGTWDNNFIGLVLATTLTEQSKLWAQLEASSNDATRFTWFFVDYQINDAARAHVGRVKMPLGFYNEIIDAKFLHPAALEPALYQTAADFVHDAYQGLGIDYEQDIAGGHVTWQAYGGNVYDTDPPLDTKDRKAFGGRVTYRTPIDGLRLMVSGYRTRVETLATGVLTNEDRGILSAEYVRDAWDLKTEYARHRFLGVSSLAYYAQVNYALGEKWSAYGRYDYVTTDKTQKHDPSFYQKVGVVGVGYKFSPNIGFRAENHFNTGYALPVASGEVDAGAGSKKWNLFVVAANFAF